MRTSTMWKALVLAGVLAATGVAAPATPIAHAANESGIHTTTGTTVGLTINWRLSSPRGVAALRARGITPDNTVNGNCGSSTITASNNGGGEATFANSATSTQGNIATYKLTDSWLNHTNNTNNTVSASGIVPSGNASFSRPLTTYTGAGIVSVVLSSLQVTLTNGNVCNGLQPSDSVTVTG